MHAADSVDQLGRGLLNLERSTSHCEEQIRKGYSTKKCDYSMPVPGTGPKASTHRPKKTPEDTDAHPAPGFLGTGLQKYVFKLGWYCSSHHICNGLEPARASQMILGPGQWTGSDPKSSRFDPKQAENN